MLLIANQKHNLIVRVYLILKNSDFQSVEGGPECVGHIDGVSTSPNVGQ